MSPEEESKAQSQDEAQADGFEAEFKLGDYKNIDEGNMVD